MVQGPVIAWKVPEQGGRVRLKNTCSLRPSFADLERRGGEAKRIVLEAGQVKDVPLNAGMVYVTTPREVEHEFIEG
jgi:hypothetical protein